MERKRSFTASVKLKPPKSQSFACLPHCIVVPELRFWARGRALGVMVMLVRGLAKYPESRRLPLLLAKAAAVGDETAGVGVAAAEEEACLALLLEVELRVRGARKREKNRGEWDSEGELQ